MELQPPLHIPTYKREKNVWWTVERSKWQAGIQSKDAALLQQQFLSALCAWSWMQYIGSITTAEFLRSARTSLNPITMRF